MSGATVTPADGANAARGEVDLHVGGMTLVLRPSFGALVRAEAELGPLFALVERAADGRMSLGEIVGLFWHCLREVPAELSREGFAEAVTSAGLRAAMPVLGRVLRQVVAGQ